MVKLYCHLNDETISIQGQYRIVVSYNYSGRFDHWHVLRGLAESVRVYTISLLVTYWLQTHSCNQKIIHNYYSLIVHVRKLYISQRFKVFHYNGTSMGTRHVQWYPDLGRTLRPLRVNNLPNVCYNGSGHYYDSDLQENQPIIKICYWDEYG